jgi:hypothetical protein
MIKDMVLENYKIRMEHSIMVNGRMIRKMVLEPKSILMGHTMTESGKMVLKKILEYLYGQTSKGMKDFGS